MGHKALSPTFYIVLLRFYKDYSEHSSCPQVTSRFDPCVAQVMFSSKVLEMVLEGSTGASGFLPLLLGKNSLKLFEHELHYLALKHHVDCHVSGLGLGPKQRGPKHDGNALNRHPVRVLVLDYPGERVRLGFYGVGSLNWVNWAGKLNHYMFYEEPVGKAQFMF